MKYRNKKRLVAVWILEKISIANKAHVVGQATTTTNVEIPKYIRPTDPYKVSELIKLNKYEAPIIYEASFFLISRGYIQHIGMEDNDIAHTSIKITDEGINALRDEIIQDEIRDYNNDFYYSYLRWWLPIVAIIVSVSSIFFSTCKKTNPNNIQVVQSPLQQLPTEQHKIETSKKTIDSLLGKQDTIQNNNGQ